MLVDSRRPARLCAILFPLATALAAPLAHAAPRPLSEAEMSGVRGADGSILGGITPAALPGAAGNPLGQGLAAAFSSSTGATLLSPTEFAAALAGTGLTPGMFPSYDGQVVAQTRVDAAPLTLDFGVSTLLQATTGLTYAGASMGTLTLKDFDARGTTIWVWQHH